MADGRSSTAWTSPWQPGEIVALLGPNGAGKTTTVETIEGHRRPDGGSVRVFGLDPRRDGARIRARCGVMLQRADLWNQVRVLEAVRSSPRSTRTRWTRRRCSSRWA